MGRKGQKTVAASLGWRVTETRHPFATPWIRMRQDDIAIPGRGGITYTYLEQAPAVFVVPVMSDGQIVLIRQYRYPVDAWCLEIPAGGTHDREGVPLKQVARDELHEEIGATCGSIEQVGMFYTSNTHSDQTSHVFLALKVALCGRPAREATEHIQIVPTPAKAAIHLARTGQVDDGPSALSLLLCEELLRRYGYLDRTE